MLGHPETIVDTCLDGMPASALLLAPMHGSSACPAEAVLGRPHRHIQGPHSGHLPRSIRDLGRAANRPTPEARSGRTRPNLRFRPTRCAIGRIAIAPRLFLFLVLIRRLGLISPPAGDRHHSPRTLLGIGSVYLLSRYLGSAARS